MKSAGWASRGPFSRAAAATLVLIGSYPLASALGISNQAFVASVIILLAVCACLYYARTGRKLELAMITVFPLCLFCVHAFPLETWWRLDRAIHVTIPEYVMYGSHAELFEFRYSRDFGFEAIERTYWDAVLWLSSTGVIVTLRRGVYASRLAGNRRSPEELVPLFLRFVLYFCVPLDWVDDVSEPLALYAERKARFDQSGAVVQCYSWACRLIPLFWGTVWRRILSRLKGL